MGRLKRIAVLSTLATVALMGAGPVDVGALVGVTVPQVTTTPVPTVTVPSQTVPVPQTPVTPPKKVTTPTVTTPAPPPPKVTVPKAPNVSPSKPPSSGSGSGPVSGTTQKVGQVVSKVTGGGSGGGSGSSGGSGSGGGGGSSGGGSGGGNLVNTVGGLLGSGKSTLNSGTAGATGGGGGSVAAGGTGTTSGTSALQALGFFGGPAGPGGPGGTSGGPGGPGDIFRSGGGRGGGLPPTLTGAEAHQLRAALELLEGCMSAISPVDREVLAMRAGSPGTAPLSRGDVASRLGLSTRQVRRAERRGLSGLRSAAAQTSWAGPVGGPFAIGGLAGPLVALTSPAVAPGGEGGNFVAARVIEGGSPASPLAALRGGTDSGPAWLVVLITVLFSVAVAGLLRELRDSVGATRFH